MGEMRLRRTLLISCAILACLMTPALGIAAEAAAEILEIRLGVHPYLASSEIELRFAPLAKEIESALGKRVRVVVSPGYPEHIDKVGQNHYEIAYLGPASYVNLVKQHGPRPLLARLEVEGKPSFRGVIVAREDSELRDLADLQGKRFAFGDRHSTMSHLVPRFMLLRAGIDTSQLEKYSFLRNHEDVALGVLSGSFDGGALKEGVFAKYRDEGLRALRWSPDISEHVFVASRELDEELARNIRKLFLSLGTTESGRAALKKIKPTVTGLSPVKDSDYDSLREILEALEKQGVLP